MPGMNSGLSPSDPTLVAAFRSAMAGSRLTVWRLAGGAWGKVQQFTVPVQYGSSG